eukprot:1438505-Amphidinium_carterae.1
MSCESGGVVICASPLFRLVNKSHLLRLDSVHEDVVKVLNRAKGWQASVRKFICGVVTSTYRLAELGKCPLVKMRTLCSHQWQSFPYKQQECAEELMTCSCIETIIVNSASFKSAHTEKKSGPQIALHRLNKRMSDGLCVSEDGLRGSCVLHRSSQESMDGPSVSQHQCQYGNKMTSHTVLLCKRVFRIQMPAPNS